MQESHGLPPSLVETIAGFSAGVISTLAVHPLDIVKTRLQVDRVASSRLGSSLRVVRSIANNEGAITGFYRGLTPNIIGNSVSWALYFLWYGKIKDGLSIYHGEEKALGSLDYFAASGVSGILTAVLTNPIWVIKTRMLSTGASAPGAYSSVSSGAMQIFRTDGIPGFYRGLIPSLFGVSHGALQFMAYEQLKRWRANASLQPTGVMSDSSEFLTNTDFIFLPALSKIFAGSITYPYQVVRSRLQTYDADQAYKGTMDAVVQLWAKEGLRGFYKGLGPNLLRVLPSTCVTFLVYENMRRRLGDGDNGWKKSMPNEKG